LQEMVSGMALPEGGHHAQAHHLAHCRSTHAVSDPDAMRYRVMAQPAAAGDAGQLAEAGLVTRAAGARRPGGQQRRARPYPNWLRPRHHRAGREDMTPAWAAGPGPGRHLAMYQVAWAGPRICMSQMHKTKDACERSKQITFIDLIGQVHERYRNPDPAVQWADNDLTALAPGSPAASSFDPGSARGPVPGSAAATGSAGGHAAAGRWGDQ
jgi:hypothetical protein